jgi:hypothetical protein
VGPESNTKRQTLHIYAFAILYHHACRNELNPRISITRPLMSEVLSKPNLGKSQTYGLELLC